MHDFINDADYVVCPYIEGKQVWCKYYARWTEMRKRCSSAVKKAKHPTYLDVTCCAEWKYFSTFKAWMETQPWEGMELDKDLLVKDNKIYSPETCCFVPAKINSLIISPKSTKGSYPIGVYRNKAEKTNPYYASCCNGYGDAGRKYLGTFPTPEEAHAAWQTEKAFQIEQRVLWWAFDSRVNHSYREDVAIILLDKAEKLRQDCAQGFETIKL